MGAEHAYSERATRENEKFQSLDLYFHSKISMISKNLLLSMITFDNTFRLFFYSLYK